MRTHLFNAVIYLNRGQFVQALSIEDGRIVAVGTTADILADAAAEDKCLDLGGRTVLPGFNDSHLHLFGTAQAARSVDLYGVTSIAELQARSRDFLAKHPETGRTGLNGRGWNQDYFTDGRLPDRHDLDAIATGFPIVFPRACGHIAVANTRALEMAGVVKGRAQVDGGQFDLDADGHPTGILRENALVLLEGLKPALSVDSALELLREVSALANAHGITSVQCNDLTVGNADSAILEEAYRQLALDNPSLRIYHQTCFSDLTALKTRINEGYHRHTNDFNRMGPLKIFVDGSLGARTAHMRQPYADDPSTNGIVCMDSPTLEAFVQTADQANVQIAIHAIGDGAMEQVLDAYATVIRNENPNRHGIIHCQITDRPLLERFKALDILAYVQPIFLHYDLHIVESRVGKDLASTSYAFKTMEDLGLHVAYGTDSPVESLDVFNNLFCALNRQDLKAFPEGGFTPEEKVDLETAIDNLTRGSAYASFEEDRKGRLLPGYMADLVVLDQPIFELDPSNIRQVQVDLTMVDGRIVYQRA